MSKLLHINADDVDFTVTTGRSVPSFLYGTRTLPEDVWGIPSFVLDSTSLRVNEYTQEVEKTPGQEFVYGGNDGRDLLSRSTPLPRGGFSFTRADLSVSRTEEELPEGGTLRKTEKDFDVVGTIRRVTGDTSFQAVLGPEHLGTIVPGRDVKVGEHILLGIWGMKAEVRVSGYEHTSKGYSMTIESIHTNASKSATSSVTTVSEKIEVLSRKMREIEDTQNAYSPDDWGSEPAGSGGSGEQGPPGPPGDTPYINYQTGTWWIGDTDTGVRAQGPQGPPGPPGESSGGGGLTHPLTQSINSSGRSSGENLISQVSRTQETVDGKIYYVYRYNLTESVESGGMITITATIDNMIPGFSDTIVSYTIARKLNNYQESLASKYKLSNFLLSFYGGQLGFFVDKDLVDTNYSPTGRFSPTMNVSFLPTV